MDEFTILSAAHCFVGTNKDGSKYNTSGEPYNWDVVAGTKSSLPTYGEVSKIFQSQRLGNLNGTFLISLRE